MSIKNYNEQGFQLVENLFSKEEMNAFIKKIIDTFMVQSRRLNLSNEKTVNFDDVDKKIFELFTKNRDAFDGCAKFCQNLIELKRYSVSEKIISHLYKWDSLLPHSAWFTYC